MKLQRKTRRDYFNVKCVNPNCKRILWSEKAKSEYDGETIQEAWSTFFWEEATGKMWRAQKEISRDISHDFMFTSVQDKTNYADYCPTCFFRIVRPEAYKEEYQTSDYWRRLRKARFEKDGYRCIKCGSAMYLCAHHTTYDNMGDFDKELDDLITLCATCHTKIHEADLDAWGQRI